MHELFAWLWPSSPQLSALCSSCHWISFQLMSNDPFFRRKLYRYARSLKLQENYTLFFSTTIAKKIHLPVHFSSEIWYTFIILYTSFWIDTRKFILCVRILSVGCFQIPLKKLFIICRNAYAFFISPTEFCKSFYIIIACASCIPFKRFLFIRFNWPSS